LEGKHTLLNIGNCHTLITVDKDGKYILDFLGEGVKSLQGTPPGLVKDAYYFVVQQYKQFSESGDTHLFDYYSRLRLYFESKLSLWGIEQL
jgi:hypothetical protein